MQPKQNPINQPNSSPRPEQQRPEASPRQTEVQPAPVAPEVAPSGPTQPVARPQLPDPVQSAAPAPVPGQPGSDPNPASGVHAGPSVANDVDVIEKEWVDQANKIVEQTKNDPYLEEEAVEALQIDYLKKRYGRDVKKPDQGK